MRMALLSHPSRTGRPCPSRPRRRASRGRVVARRRFISCRRVVATRAPVAPIGWPSAIAPPLTLTLAMSSDRSRAQAMTCAAKASFSSIRSMSASARLVFASSARTAGTGPMPMRDGSTPADVHAATRAERLDARLRDFVLAREHEGRRSVRDAGGVAGVHGAVLLEDRRQPRDRRERRLRARVLVRGDDTSPFLSGHRHRHDLVRKAAGADGLGRRGAATRPRRRPARRAGSRTRGRGSRPSRPSAGRRAGRGIRPGTSRRRPPRCPSACRSARAAAGTASPTCTRSRRRGRRRSRRRRSSARRA